jgi:hypothetical protein
MRAFSRGPTSTPTHYSYHYATNITMTVSEILYASVNSRKVPYFLKYERCSFLENAA